MRKEIEKGSEEWNAFTAVWQFYQDFAIPEDDEKYWDDLVKAMKEIETEHKHPLANWLAWGVAKALEDIAKGDK